MLYLKAVSGLFTEVVWFTWDTKISNNLKIFFTKCNVLGGGI